VEFGIRTAIGATPADILHAVLGRGAVLIGAGVVFRIAASSCCLPDGRRVSIRW